MFTLRTIFCILVAVFGDTVLSENSELLSVTVLHRHGSRSPRILYKNDPHGVQTSTIWPEGLGQLSNIGKTESFALGRWYRKKYKHFIPEKYNSNFVRILSSNVDRCLMSAACNLAGLYPPKEEQIWNENIQWQPIPIHTTPQSLDGIISADDRPCKKYKSLYEELIRSEGIVKFLESKKSLFEYLSNHTGDDISKPFDVIALHDALFVENYQNLTLPDWTKKVFPNETLPIATMNYALDTNTTQLGRLISGLLVNYITTFFEDVVQNPSTSQKFLILSGHDSTIARLMNVLGVYDYTWPEYASTLAFELRRNGNEVFLRIYFRDSKKLRDIKLPQCTLDCNFEAFKTITKPFRINEEEWIKECSSD